MSDYDIATLKQDLEDLKLLDNRRLVRQESRDFFCYAPVLKRRPDRVTSGLVAAPRDEAEVIRVPAPRSGRRPIDTFRRLRTIFRGSRHPTLPCVERMV